MSIPGTTLIGTIVSFEIKYIFSFYRVNNIVSMTTVINSWILNFLYLIGSITNGYELRTINHYLYGRKLFPKQERCFLDLEVNFQILPFYTNVGKLCSVLHRNCI